MVGFCSVLYILKFSLAVIPACGNIFDIFWITLAKHLWFLCASSNPGQISSSAIKGHHWRRNHFLMLQSCIRMVNFTTFYSYQSCNQFCGNNRFFDEMQQHNYLFLRRFCDISLSFRYEISRHICRKRAGVFRQWDLAGHPFGNRYGYSNMIWGHQLFLMIHLLISSLFFQQKQYFHMTHGHF